MNGKVSPDGSRKGSCRVGLSKHNTTSLHRVQSLPNLDKGILSDLMNTHIKFSYSRRLFYHGADRAASHVGDEATEESLAGEVSVVLLQVLHRGLHHLHGNQLEPLLLKARDNLANQATLDTIGLDHNKGPLGSHDEKRVFIARMDGMGWH